MDVDNDPIDPSLLLQFTCLNTTDRTDLIKQFKELFEEVNDDTANFFLEMNNWNLQNAICAFLDYQSPKSDFSMAVVQEAPVLEGLTPNMDFIMAYTIRNDGREAWPRSCFLMCWCGNFVCNKRFPVEAVEPGCVTTQLLNFTAPSEPGHYQSSLRLSTPSGVFFGRVLNLAFKVHAKLEDNEEQRLSDELAARMALIDNADCKVMEEEPNVESFDVVANPLSNSIGVDQRNVTDFNHGDHHAS